MVAPAGDGVRGAAAGVASAQEPGFDHRRDFRVIDAKKAGEDFVGMFAKEGGGPPWCGIDSLDPERGCDDGVLAQHGVGQPHEEAAVRELGVAEEVARAGNLRGGDTGGLELVRDGIGVAGGAVLRE